MKNILIMMTVLSLLFIACGKDNYDEPTSTISGTVSYKGKPIGVRGTGEVVKLQLYQEGFQLKAPVQVYVGQDGSFKVKIFDGKYKLIGTNNNGPWLNNTDTVQFELKGNIDVNYEVIPYYTIENAKISLGSDHKLSSTFNINKVFDNATVDYYMLLVSRTSFVDDGTNIFRKDYKDGATSVSLSEDLSQLKELSGDGPLFARIGVRANAGDQAVYSEVIKIK
ncbi:DUF3823 domain-containing protein [Sphingobacterium faecium]|uniref:DUF3823 domain-containing protein n=1 Tax=Sphingobacterium faecium TaxID=34087 RepID=UPI002468E6CC|nr:DUF3823 domain-containing protein [Sphingobacterium faecium]MDH5826994.1 DUF3823 domain-containing protein [Sphingobacterium faecium]